MAKGNNIDAEDKPKEPKDVKFRRLANIRMRQVVKGLIRIENLGKSYAYDFTEQDIEKIVSVIEQRLDSLKQTFVNRLQGKTNVVEDIFKEE